MYRSRSCSHGEDEETIKKRSPLTSNSNEFPHLQEHSDPRKTTFTNESFICDIDDLEDGDKKKAPFDLDSEKSLKENSCLQTLQNKFVKHKSCIIKIFKLCLFVLYNVYLAFAIHISWDKAATWCDGAKFLVIITSIAYFIAFYNLVLRRFIFPKVKTVLEPLTSFLERASDYQYFSQVVWLIVWGLVAAFLIYDTYGQRYRLVSVAGVILFVFAGYIFSKHRSQIKWRPVLWGLLVQFCMGLLVLRWSVGQAVFSCLGDKISGLLETTDKGSSFVFGYLVTGEMSGGVAPQLAVFAFKVLSVVIFFSFLVSLLYYYGVMQALVSKLGWLLQETIGTTACESMNAAANIFLGMTEAPLLIRPYLPVMTKSELHAVMTGGFATIAGSVLAAYINFGINASHLITASVMAAPAALGFAKLVYPETEPSKTKAGNIEMQKGEASSALDAATAGASAAVALVSGIASNLIAFVAFIALADVIFGWCGSLLGWNFLSFEWLLSKVFVPVSLAVGADWEDREHVAGLIGLKTVVNEFVAYRKLAELSKEKVISARSEAIATFALCGFSNLSSIGIQLGSLTTLAPERRGDLSSIALRAMITGTATCCLNACVAGALLQYAS